ncbi:hypothetical protein BKA93DRAFT_714148, partial [Sparassis latifolia]
KITEKKAKPKISETIHTTAFPPAPPPIPLIYETIHGFCTDTDPSQFIEMACTVCALLEPVTELTSLTEVQANLSLLCTSDFIQTRQEHFTEQDPIQELSGSVVLPSCDNICTYCLSYLQQGKVPTDALANGLWIDAIPLQLQDLTWMEKMLIACVKHNY